MAENKHQPGKMDITSQEKTFEGFMRWVINVAIFCLVILILLAIAGT